MISKIIIGYDGSEHAKAAIEFLKNLEEFKKAELHVVTVVDFTQLYSYGVDIPQSVYESIKNHNEEMLKTIVNEIKGAGGNAIGVMLEGSPADAILDYAQKINADMIVVGSRGLSTFRGLLLGSVSAKLVRESKIPVLVVKKQQK
ncbi:MAG: universal stress protein [Nitrososphaeria archaeon]|nr:universal stress protein [Conexivisphaerales archaeon]